MMEAVNHRLGQHGYLYMGRRFFRYRDHVDHFYLWCSALDSSTKEPANTYFDGRNSTEYMCIPCGHHSVTSRDITFGLRNEGDRLYVCIYNACACVICLLHLAGAIPKIHQTIDT